MYIHLVRTLAFSIISTRRRAHPGIPRAKARGPPRAHPGQKPGGPGTPRAASGASMGHAVPLHRSTVPDIKEPKVSHPAKQDFIHTRALPSSSDQPALVGRETILNRSIQQIKPHAYRVRAPASRLELEGCILP